MLAARWVAVQAQWRATPQPTRYLLLALAACAAWVLLWPGDIPWINDEPQLLGIALQANRAHRPALLGLAGSVGLHYGPVPAWYYQLSLLLTHNPLLIGCLKTALSLAVLSWTCWRLAERLALPKAPLLLVLLSPFVYHYTRMLWDNSITLVLSPLLLLACVETLHRRSFRAFVAALALSVLLILSHLNNVMIIVPCMGVVLVSERRWLWRPGWRLALALGVAALLVLPYAVYAAKVPFKPHYHAPLRDTLAGVALGAKYFSYAGWTTAAPADADAPDGATWGGSPGWGGYYLPEMYLPGFLLPAPVTNGLVAITALAYVWFVIGLGLVAGDLWTALHDRQPWTLRQKYALLVVATFVFSALFFGATRMLHFPHYLVGTWMTYGYCVWRGAAWLLRRPRWRWGFWAHVAAMAVLLVAVKTHLNIYGGSRSAFYGATLANQMTIVRASFACSLAGPVDFSHNYNYDHFPHAFYVLYALLKPNPLPPDWRQRPPHHLRVSFADPADPLNGWLVIEPTD